MPNQRHEPKKILAVLSDLFFSVKITDAAKKAGMTLEFVKEANQVMAKAKERPALIIIDLNFDAIHPVDLIRKLKAAPELKGVTLIGYLSHIQAELKQEAQEAGCNMVLARSAFSQNLPMILKRHSGHV